MTTKAIDTADCDRFPEGSRLREICDGTADLPPAKLDAYRIRLGIDSNYVHDAELRKRERPKPKPVPQPERAARAKIEPGKRKGCQSCGGKSGPTPKPNGRGPGSQLLKVFEAAGVPHCNDCLILAGRMDRWGKRGCLRRLDKIVADILPRAREWMKENKPFFHRLLSLTKLEDTALNVAIRRKVKDAIRSVPDSSSKVRAVQRPRRRAEFPEGRNWVHSFRVGNGEPPYVTVEDLSRDALSLLPRLPSDIVQVIGSARSGLVPATLLAEMLHVPISIIRNRQGDIVPAGNGWRLLQGAPKRKGRTLVVDDTTMTGNSMLRIKQIIERARLPGPFLYVTIYCNPAAVNKPDLWAVDLPWPHLLEWNLFNSVLLDSFALDFDGILCQDCPRANDDDGARYKQWMIEVRPLHLVRRGSIQLIVTARLEKYRPLTAEWLKKWGIRVKKMVMGPWATLAERHGEDVAAWKAETLNYFLRKRGGIPPRFFIESDPRQAERIAELTSGLVVCPTARRCFGVAQR